LTKKASWKFEEGDEIAPGRVALSRLGGGTLFETYIAWDDRLFFIVVAKLIRPDRADDPDAIRRLRRETETLQRLSHPVVVRSFASVLEGPHPHLVLEHMEGPTLRSLLRSYGPLPVEQVLPLALNLCSGLHYMNTENMVHLDVKPGNIIMGAPPILIDLSLARTLERAARIDSPIGTDPYMAPEQCEPDARGPVGAPADVWGLGATLHEAITGRQPFTQDDFDSGGQRERYPQLDQEPAPLPPDTPTPLAETVLGCLEMDPTKRPTAAELGMGLQPLVAAAQRRRVLGRPRPRLR
jgi:eukaryotic-like serine/threonine-protein kinase